MAASLSGGGDEDPCSNLERLSHCSGGTGVFLEIDWAEIAGTRHRIFVNTKNNKHQAIRNETPEESVGEPSQPRKSCLSRSTCVCRKFAEELGLVQYSRCKHQHCQWHMRRWLSLWRFSHTLSNSLSLLATSEVRASGLIQLYKCPPISLSL